MIVLLGIRNWIGEFMKIITSEGIYVQKKDLDLIFNVTDNQKILHGENFTLDQAELQFD